VADRLALALVQLGQIAGRFWNDLVCLEDYFEPTAGWMTRRCSDTADGEFIVALNSQNNALESENRRHGTAERSSSVSGNCSHEKVSSLQPKRSFPAMLACLLTVIRAAKKISTLPRPALREGLGG
jgi:hypothetical protein